MASNSAGSSTQLRSGSISRPGKSVESKDNPATLSGDPVLPAFVLDLRPLW